MPYEKKLPHYFGQNMLAKSLNELAYTNHPKFVSLAATGLPFKAHVPVDGELPVEAMQQRSALYRTLCERIWDPENVGIPKLESTAVAEDGKAYYGISIADLMSAGLLAVGAELSGTRSGLTRKATVLSEGSLELEDGSVYPAPSPAGAAALNIEACNGWDFWRAPTPKGPQRLSRLRQTYREQHKTK